MFNIRIKKNYRLVYGYNAYVKLNIFIILDHSLLEHWKPSFYTYYTKLREGE